MKSAHSAIPVHETDLGSDIKATHRVGSKNLKHKGFRGSGGAMVVMKNATEHILTSYWPVLSKNVVQAMFFPYAASR